MWKLFLDLPAGYLAVFGAWLLLLAAWLIIEVRLWRRWRTRRGRRGLLLAGLSLWMLCGLLTAVEAGFALLYDTTDSFDMTSVSKRWFRIHVAPDVRTLTLPGGEGIHYRAAQDFVWQLPPGQTRLLFLGDSFTFGHGVAAVADRFSDRIAASRSGSTLRVDNLSWPGTDLNWGAAVLSRLFEGHARCDRVVYVFCPNDIEAFHDPRMSGSIAAAQFEPPAFLCRDTYFFNWACFRLQALRRPAVRNYYDFVRDYYTGPAFDRFEQRLAETARLARAHDAELSVAIFPFLHCLGTDYPFRDAHRRVAQACQRHGVRCLDLEPALTPHAGEGLIVSRFDAHPNERAHALAATAIEAFLDAPPADVRKQ